MPKVTLIEHSGTVHTVDAEVGESVMHAAMSNSVPGIIADCAGNCACATCHVYVDPDWLNRVPPPSSTEQEMIECALYVEENSRLSCQIEMNDELDGLIVRIPESQV